MWEGHAPELHVRVREGPAGGTGPGEEKSLAWNLPGRGTLIRAPVPPVDDQEVGQG